MLTTLYYYMLIVTICIDILCQDGLWQVRLSNQWGEQIYSSRELAEMQIFMQILVSCAE